MTRFLSNLFGLRRHDVTVAARKPQKRSTLLRLQKEVVRDSLSFEARHELHETKVRMLQPCLIGTAAAASDRGERRFPKATLLLSH
jgi:hypothetical protein